MKLMIILWMSLYMLFETTKLNSNNKIIFSCSLKKTQVYSLSCNFSQTLNPFVIYNRWAFLRWPEMRILAINETAKYLLI